jgi:hypothetical protein
MSVFGCIFRGRDYSRGPVGCQVVFDYVIVRRVVDLAELFILGA